MSPAPHLARCRHDIRAKAVHQPRLVKPTKCDSAKVTSWPSLDRKISPAKWRLFNQPKMGDSPINIGNSPADLVDFNQDGFYHNKTGKFDTWMWDLSSKIVHVTNRLTKEKVNSTNQCEYFMVNYQRIFCQEG